MEGFCEWVSHTVPSTLQQNQSRPRRDENSTQPRKPNMSCKCWQSLEDRSSDSLSLLLSRLLFTAPRSSSSADFHC